jgi:hypothetical protein
MAATMKEEEQNVQFVCYKFDARLNAITGPYILGHVHITD